MKTPTVHLNGTSKGELVTQCENALRALRIARDALAEMAPHGRDYYPQGDDAFKAAQSEYAARQAALSTIMADVAKIWEAIEDQGQRSRWG